MSPPRDKEVVAMPKWPIRVKLIAGLSLVVGMMLTLMGGSIFGLHSFHASNLIARRPAPRAGGVERPARSTVVRLETAAHGDARGAAGSGDARSRTPAGALVAYYTELRKNTTRGNRADDGRDELGLAFLIDNDLTAILAELEPAGQGRARCCPARRSTSAGTPSVRRGRGRRRPRRADRPARTTG